MSIVIGTLALNEMEWLPRLYEQHKDWPGLQRWVFVEAADTMYAQANPNMVSKDGLSVDGTSEWLADLARRDDRIVHIPHGFTGHENPAQGKCAARNRYLQVANEVHPEFVVIVDADEFYTKSTQTGMCERMKMLKRDFPGVHTGFIFGLRSIWRPPSMQHVPLFKYEAVGCLWSVPICRGWLWMPGMQYLHDHNSPCDANGVSLNRSMARLDRLPTRLDCLHMGYTSSLKTREAKRAYYETRGEGKTDHRQKYVDCRRAYENYKFGDALPHGAHVIEYYGTIPECFL